MVHMAGRRSVPRRRRECLRLRRERDAVREVEVEEEGDGDGGAPAARADRPPRGAAAALGRPLADRPKFDLAARFVHCLILTLGR